MCAMLLRRCRNLGSPVVACEIRWIAAASLPLSHLLLLVFCNEQDHAWSIWVPHALPLYY